MKKKILFAFLIFAFACRTPKKSPFVIISKDYSTVDKAMTIYKFTDQEGVTMDFIDSANKYNVGDTLTPKHK